MNNRKLGLVLALVLGVVFLNSYPDNGVQAQTPGAESGNWCGEAPRAPDGAAGAPNRPEAFPPRVPGRGGQGPVPGFLPPPPGPARGRGGTRAPAAQAAANAAYRAKYPP